MKKLSVEKMEKIEGGDYWSLLWCTFQMMYYNDGMKATQAARICELSEQYAAS